MIEVEPHGCKHCKKPIPDNRAFCYVCDLVVNGVHHKTPKTIHELVDEFLHSADLKDYEAEDIIHIFDKFEKHVEDKKYSIKIQ
jgi:hypothetical protein